MAFDTEDERQWLDKLNETANTLMERKMILDARDKLLRLKQDRQTDLATAVAMIGTCLDMCPEQERYFRIETNCVSPFEMDYSTDQNGVPDQMRMVKEYRRSGADQKEPLPHELRPIEVLRRTMDYLCIEIIDKHDTCEMLGEWFDFVWSRTRSIRKDITQQHLINIDSVTLIEQCARFHIFCSYFLCEEEMKCFDPKINDENLYNCLQTLKEFYYDLNTRSISCPNESEFRAYDVLLNLRNGETLSELKHYRKEIRNSSDVRFAVHIYQAYHSKNYIKFFQYIRRASFFMSCILNNYLNAFRIDMLNRMRVAFTVPKSSSEVAYPVQKIIEHFGFDNHDDLSHFCDLTDLKYDVDYVYFQRTLPLNPANIKRRSQCLVLSKLTTTPGRAILCPHGVNNVIVQLLPIHSSFDVNNRLIFDVASLSTFKEKENHTTKVLELANVIVAPPIEFAKENGQTSLFKLPSLSAKTTTAFEHPAVVKSDNAFSFNLQPKKILPTVISNGSLITNSNNLTMFGTSPPSPPLQSLASSSSSLSSTSAFSFNLKNKTLTSLDDEKMFSPSDHQQQKIPAPVSHPLAISELTLHQLLDQLVATLIRQQCQQSLHRYRQRHQILAYASKQIFEEIFCSIIKKLVSDVIQTQRRNKHILERISNQVLQSWLTLTTIAAVKETYREVKVSRRKLVAKKVAEQQYNAYLHRIIKQTAQRVLLLETAARDQQITQWRQQRLQRKYFLLWRLSYLARKKYKYYRDTFPAAPIRQASVSTTTQQQHPTISSVHAYDSCSFIGDEYSNAIKRELIYSQYKDPATINKYIAKQLQSRPLRAELRTPLEQLKRAHYLQRKYYQLWLHRVRLRKILFIRSQFPAAPSFTKSHRSLSVNKFSSGKSGSGRLTVIDRPIQDASAVIKRNLLQKLDLDFESTIKSIKRKLDLREELRTVSNENQYGNKTKFKEKPTKRLMTFVSDDDLVS